MTIKEVSKLYGLSNDTLRFYEKEGLIGPIKKTSGGIRNYDEHDLARIQFIKCMRSADLSIPVLRQYVKLYDLGKSTEKERREILVSERDKLIEKINQMNEALERLNKKIELYDSGKLEYLLEKKDKNE